MIPTIKCLDCTDPPFYKPSVEEMEAHIAAEHLNYFPYKCPTCADVRLPTEYQLERHNVLVHRRNTQLPIDKRSVLPEAEESIKLKLESCQRYSNLHGIWHIDKIQWKKRSGLRCLECGNRFDFDEDLEAHIAAVHLSMMPYPCKKCKYTGFPTEKYLVLHYMNDHRQETFEITKHVSTEDVRKQMVLEHNMALSISAWEEENWSRYHPNTLRPAEVTANVPGSQPENRAREHASFEQPPAPDRFKNVPGRSNVRLSKRDGTGDSPQIPRKQPKQPLLYKSKECQMCLFKITDDDDSKTAHANIHAQLPFWVCGKCEVPMIIHEEDAAVRLHGKHIAMKLKNYKGDLEKVEKLCFPEGPHISD